MKVLLLSDTHGVLPEVRAMCAESDHVIHAGDVGSAEVLTELMECCPVTVVRGNVDRGAWAEQLPYKAEVEIAGVGFYVIHNRADLKSSPPPDSADYVVFGHSHKPLEELHGRQIYLNPGNCGRRRFRLPVTAVSLRLPERLVEFVHFVG